MPHIDGMKSEIIKYQALVKSIKPLEQRKDAKASFFRVGGFVGAFVGGHWFLIKSLLSLSQ